MREMFARAFLTRTRDEWAAAFEGADGCVAPVLDLAEAPAGAHLVARGTFTGVRRRPASVGAPPAAHARPHPVAPPAPGADSREVLSDWGFDKAEIDALIAQGTVAEDGGAAT
jgi:alpha-methylacyl-CoA racemase